MAAWLEKNVHTRAGKNSLQAIAMAPPSEKGQLLKRAAADAGYTGPCPLADAE